MKKTIVDLFESSVKQYPNNTFLLEKTGKKFEPTTYAQVKEKVYQLGAGLQALGVKKGDNMALLSEGRNMWVIGELAMFYAGAVNVPLSIKLEESNDLLFRLIHGDVKFVMVSGTQLKKVRSIIDQLPEVKKVIVFDEQAEYGEKEISLAEVQKMGGPGKVCTDRLTNKAGSIMSREWFEKYRKIVEPWLKDAKDENGDYIIDDKGEIVKSGEIAEEHKKDYENFFDSLFAQVQKFTEWADPKHEIKGVMEYELPEVVKPDQDVEKEKAIKLLRSMGYNVSLPGEDTVDTIGGTIGKAIGGIKNLITGGKQ